jgi:hypothetical protein
VSPLESLTWAATAIVWSVINVTNETVGSTVVTLPTSAPSAVAGSPRWMPSSEPLSISTVAYQSVGSREITFDATGL